jgi:hypothetical protein
MPLIIRQAQMDVFAELARERFISAMVDHVRTYFPGRHAQLGDVGLHKALSDAIDKAKNYGLTSKRDVCKFINVTMTLGPDFDRTLPILHDILASHEPPAVRARRLSDTCLAIYRTVKQRQKRDPS